MSATYVIGGAGVFAARPDDHGADGVYGDAWIQCLLCDAISHNRYDVEQRYCGACHVFHDLVEQCRRDVVNGAGHECSEWPTARGLCALCGAEV